MAYTAYTALRLPTLSGQTADSRQQTADSRQQTADSKGGISVNLLTLTLDKL
jgi:hypothetical protein